MIFSILLILLVFSIVLAFVWIWFFKNEMMFCEKLYKMGIKEFDQEQYKKARTLFLKIIGISPQYKDARYRLGLTYIKLNEYDKAKEHLEKSLASSPNDVDILSNLALTLQHLEDFDAAEKLYTKAIQENEKDNNSYFGIGLLKFQLKNYSEALEYFKKADELSPNNSLYLFYINKCKDQACDYEDDAQVLEVISNYLEMAAVPELAKEVNISLAVAYAKLGQMDISEGYCKKSIAENPEDTEAYKILGLMRLVRKDFDETKGLLKTALNLAPNNEELHNLLSYVLCYQADNCPLAECREKYFELVRKFLK